MLKKSKRILSLVLALIMICSTMGVMAFAAENGGDGHEYCFSGNGSINMDFTEHGTRVAGNAILHFSGVWNDTERTLSWDSCYVTFSGTNSFLMECNGPYNVGGSNSVKEFELYFVRNDDDPVLKYKMTLTFNETRRTFALTYAQIINGSTGVQQAGVVNYTIED